MPAIPIIGAVAGGLIVSNGAKKAASTQAAAASGASADNLTAQREAQAYQERKDAQARLDNEPWRAAGANALGQLTQGMASGGELTRNFTMGDFQADPGYAFRQAEGQKAITNSAAARGGLLSGAAAKAMARYSQGLASAEFGSAYNRFNGDRDQKYNKLASLAGVGQVAANQNGQNAMQVGQNVSAGMMNTAQQNGNNMMGASNARASSYMAQGNALTGVINNGLSAWNQYNASKPPVLGESGGVNGGGWY